MILYFIILFVACIFDSEQWWMVFMLYCFIETIKILYEDHRDEWTYLHGEKQSENQDNEKIYGS
jgi:hypothetical protein